MKSLLIILSLVLSLNCFAKEKIVLTTANSVLLSTGVDMGSMTTAMLDIANLVLLRAGRDYPIYLVLDSPGGSIYAGDNFIQFAKTVKNLHTITIFSASMAAGIAQALPGKRYITEHGQFMFHRASMSMSGQVSDGEFESRLAMVKRVIRRMEIANASRMNISLPVYKQKVKDEWWMDASESVANRAADAVVDILCSSALIKKKIKVKQRTLFGEFTSVRSACPLIP